jgi:SAM-dependent methyltransferase
VERPYLYAWDLPGAPTPIAHPDLGLAQATVRELIEQDVRAALAAAGPGARALDLACNEGWWSHRLVAWGAAEVVGIDARAEHVERAAELRDRAGLRDVITFHHGDATRLDADALGGPFDVVLHLGLLYHLEDPIGSLRAARALCRGLLVVESQACRAAPVAHAWGSSDDACETAEAVWAARWERDDDFPLASVGGVVSLIPNRAALEQALRAAGARDVRFAAPREHHVSGFRAGDRLVALAT